MIDDYIVVFRRSSELHYGTTEGIALSDDQYYSLYFLLNPHYENNLLTRESYYEIVKKYYLTHKEDFYYFK